MGQGEVAVDLCGYKGTGPSLFQESRHFMSPLAKVSGYGRVLWNIGWSQWAITTRDVTCMRGDGHITSGYSGHASPLIEAFQKATAISQML